MASPVWWTARHTGKVRDVLGELFGLIDPLTTPQAALEALEAAHEALGDALAALQPLVPPAKGGQADDDQ